MFNIHNTHCVLISLLFIVISGEKQLKEFSSFLQHHQNQLKNIIARNIIPTIDKENGAEPCLMLENSNKDTFHLQPVHSVRINFPYNTECVSTMDLIQSDNKCLNKTIAVFLELCMEVRYLSDEGNRLLSKCFFINEELTELSQNSRAYNETYVETPVPTDQIDKNKVEKFPLSAVLITKINHYLGIFVETQQFIERCFLVVNEIIKQFIALFDVDNSSYINVDYSSLHFQVG